MKKASRITFCITDRCGYECKFCFVPPMRDATELPRQPWIAAARQLAKRQPGVEFVITGGEPIFHKGVDEIAQAASASGAVVHFNSSGRDIDAKAARRLALTGVKHFNLSIDGPPPLHNRLRGDKNAYRFADEALDNMAGNAPEIRRNVVTVVMGANLEALPGFLGSLEEDDRVQGMYLQLITNPRGPAGGDAWLDDPDLWHPDRDTRLRVIDEIIARREKGGKILNPLSALRAMRLLMDNPAHRAKGICNVHEFGFFVDPRGNVTLCGLFAPAGNITEQSVGEIMDSPKFAEIVAKMRRCELGCHRQINCASAKEKPA